MFAICLAVALGLEIVFLKPSNPLPSESARSTTSSYSVFKTNLIISTLIVTVGATIAVLQILPPFEHFTSYYQSRTSPEESSAISIIAEENDTHFSLA